jgi:hypothetical protein
MASYPIRAKWFGWTGGGGGGGATGTQPGAAVTGSDGKTYTFVSISGPNANVYTLQFSGFADGDEYSSALFVDDVYQTDGGSSGWNTKSGGVQSGPHRVVVGVEPGSGAGLTGNAIGAGDVTIDFGTINFPA